MLQVPAGCRDASLLNHGERKWLQGCLRGRLCPGVGRGPCLPPFCWRERGEDVPTLGIVTVTVTGSIREGHGGDRFDCGDLF